MSTGVRRGRSNRCGAAPALDPTDARRDRQGEAKQRRIEAGQLDRIVLRAFVPDIRDVLYAKMPDGSFIRPSAKVDAMLAAVGIENLPNELKQLLVTGVQQRLRKSRGQGRFKVGASVTGH